MIFASNFNFGIVFSVTRWITTKLLRHNREELLHVDLIPGLLPQVSQLAPDVGTTAPEAIGNTPARSGSASTRTMTRGCRSALPVRTGNRAGTTSTPFATIASGDRKFSHQRGAGVLDHMSLNPKLTPNQQLASLPRSMVRRLPELPKMKSPNMTDVLPEKALHPHLPHRPQQQLELHGRNRRKTQEKMLSNDVLVDLI
jgi:hypothetical protein